MDKKSLQVDLEELFSQGIDKLHVVADFDGTLTKEYVNGVKVHSIIAVLRDQPGYLSPEYQQAAHELFQKYHTYEGDISLSFDERKAKLEEWWTSHYRLLIKSGIKKQDIQKVATSGVVQFREGVREFLHLAHKRDIPVVVFSATGLGEAIPMYFEHEQVNFPNVHFVVNQFQWDEKGNATGYREPVIHSLNKDETVISSFTEIDKVISHRKNVLLLGNGQGDLGMTKGHKPEKEVTIGFVDPEEREKKLSLEIVFQHVLVGGYEEINKVLQKF